MSTAADKLTFTELRDLYNEAVGHKDATIDELEDAIAKKRADADADVDLEQLRANLNEAVAEVERLHEELGSVKATERARSQFRKVEVGSRDIEVKEPDMYRNASGRSFLTDLYNATINNHPDARTRIDRHQQYEAEKRAVTTSSLGGIIPPAYLLDLYAKASRNGRVFADQCNGQSLPDVGMSVIVPRITTAAAAGVQATENSALTTQDVAETDLTVPVRTLGGYLPVSRQGIERAAYSDEILFEDLVARYWASLDVQALNGSGSSGQMLGLLGTSSISSSTASTATVVGVWPKIADVIQQINAAAGGLGYVADKIVMHPRRWGFFEAALDSQNRPTFGISGQPSFNVVGTGRPSGYGEVGYIHGLPVFTDANIPTNLGAGTNEDRIIVMASSIVHLWERSGDPVTLSFEQQAGTSLQVQLIAYGYAAFTAGRYPAASGVVSGAGLVPPTF